MIGVPAGSFMMGTGTDRADLEITAFDALDEPRPKSLRRGQESGSNAATEESFHGSGGRQ